MSRSPCAPAMLAGALFAGAAVGGTAIAGAALAGTTPPASAEVAVPEASAPPLGLDAAGRMANQCIERSKSKGWPAFSIAIVDASGALVLLRREDGAAAVTAEAAMLKAKTSARAGIASSALAAMSRDQPTRDLFILLQLTDDPGGVPVLRSGRLIGAVGVSGGSDEQDTRCAKSIVDAFGTK